MTTKPEAFDIEAAKRVLKDAYTHAASLRYHLALTLDAVIRERAKRAQAIQAACRAQREKDISIILQQGGDNRLTRYIAAAIRSRYPTQAQGEKDGEK